MSALPATPWWKDRNCIKLGTVFSVIYFVQAAANLPDLPLLFILKNTLKLSPTEAQIFWTVAGLAWVIKPAWGYLSDNYPILGYRRKSYLCGMSFLAASVWFGMAYISYYEMYEYYRLLILFSLSGAGYAAVDVVCDGLMTENSKTKNGIDYADQFVNVQWFGGGIASALIAYAYFQGIFPSEVEQQGRIVDMCIGSFCYRGPLISLIFLLTGLAPLMTLVVVTLFLREERVESVSLKKFLRVSVWSITLLWVLEKIVPRIIGHSPYFYLKLPLYLYLNVSLPAKILSIFLCYLLLAAILWVYIKKPRFYWPLIVFIFLWGFNPSVGEPMRYYMIDVLHFDGSFFGLMGLFGAIAAVGGVLIYHASLKALPTVSYKAFLYFSIILAAVGLLVEALYLQAPGTEIFGWTIRVRGVAIASAVFFKLLGYAGFLIPLAIAVKVARETLYPAVVYAWFMSVSNFANMMSGLTGAWLYDVLLPLPFKDFPTPIFSCVLALWCFAAIWLFCETIMRRGENEIKKHAISLGAASLLFWCLPVVAAATYSTTYPISTFIGDGSFLALNTNRVLILRLFVFISAFFTLAAIPLVYFVKLPERQNADDQKI